MIIKYKFATGEVTEVEVSDEIGTVILDSRREEHADNERHRYHTAFSLDDMTYEDKDYLLELVRLREPCRMVRLLCELGGRAMRLH